MPLVLIGLGILGAAAGSFLTVVVSRLGTGETILWGRSHCIHCKKTLRWFELLPVLSFIAQGGQCRSCAGNIPRVYLCIELATALLFIAIGLAVLQGAIPPPPFAAGATFSPYAGGVINGAGLLVLFFLYYAFFAAVAVAVSFYDYLHRLIPTVLIWPLAVIGFLAHAAGALQSHDASRIGVALIVAFAAFAAFWSLWFFSHGRAMGRGDSDVALAITLALGMRVALLGFLFTFWIGAGFGIMAVLAGRMGWKSEIPFAPFLFLGAIIALLGFQFFSHSFRFLNIFA